VLHGGILAAKNVVHLTTTGKPVRAFCHFRCIAVDTTWGEFVDHYAEGIVFLPETLVFEEKCFLFAKSGVEKVFGGRFPTGSWAGAELVTGSPPNFHEAKLSQCACCWKEGGTLKAKHGGLRYFQGTTGVYYTTMLFTNSSECFGKGHTIGSQVMSRPNPIKSSRTTCIHSKPPSAQRIMVRSP
jgi:hypothetical protein